MSHLSDPIGPKSLRQMRAVQSKMRKAKTPEERQTIAEALRGLKSGWDEELEREPKSAADIPSGIRGQSKKR